MPISKLPRARSLALATASLLLGMSGPSFVFAQAAAQPAPPPAAVAAPKATSKVKLTSLEEWDTQIDMLQRVTQSVYAGTSTQDLGGHELQYYWQQYVLTGDVKDKLESLRDKAQKQSVAKDTAGFQKTLDEASATLTAEHAKGYVIVMFLTAQAPVVYHQYQLGPWLARATDADRKAINDRVNATYEGLSRELVAAMKLHDADGLSATSARFYKLIAEPIAFFNAERARLVKAQSELPNPVPVSPRKRGDKPCPVPVPPVKGREKASLGADFPSSEAFYPPAAKQNNVEGATTLRASISETGCIQAAEVVGTSGVAELDEGALNLAMAGSYVPGAGAGDKPIAGTMLFRVKFEQPPEADGAQPGR